MRCACLSLLVLLAACEEEEGAAGVDSGGGQPCSENEPCDDSLYCYQGRCETLKKRGERCYVDEETGTHGGCSSDTCDDKPTQLICSVDTQGLCACPVQGQGICGQAAKKLQPCVDNVSCTNLPSDEYKVCEDRVSVSMQALMAFLGLRPCADEVEQQARQYIACTLDEYCVCEQ